MLFRSSAIALLLVSAAVFAQSRSRLELLRNVRIPAFIQSIRQAEFAYAASGNGFTCDGTKLPNVGRLEWMPADTLRQNGYAVHLECNGRRFRIIVDPPNGKPSYALEPNGRISVP